MDTDGNLWNLSCARVLMSTGGGVTVSGLVLLFIIFVICGAYFGGAESAFSAMNKIRIKAKADDGDHRAKNAMFISSNFDRALTTLLIGNNVTHIAAASIATVISTRLYGTSDTVTFICTVVTTILVFLFSEMIPKSFANDRSETTALLCAGSLKILMKLLYPLTAFFTLISNAMTKLSEKIFRHEEEPSITEDELYDIVETIEEEGGMNKEQGELIKSALDFSGTLVRDVMTMRDDICAVDSSLSNEEILELLRNSTHTRFPVYTGDIDNVIGIMQMRVFIREYLKKPDFDFTSYLIPAYHVSPDAMIDDLLSEMRQHASYLGIVTDSDAHTVGLVTIEDFLEELVGEIWDEDDIVDSNFIGLGGNRYRANAHLTLGEIASRLGLENDFLPSSKPLISYVIEKFGRMPEEEESFTVRNLEFTVDGIEDGRVSTVEIHILSDEDMNEEGGVS